ncbi:hypothetical protein HB364_13805 [Pseudoflavitalea sp. X16]|uniref:hypothetical protein n=1 Tax=Paraflavitalea devenefica TaxID=2716334 RepID=UPI00141EBF57|nr:hypothetical protein [Paraflavitalea devenefica]NII26163.1 hypothetical protein [Paraflavitalea devenefica]
MWKRKKTGEQRRPSPLVEKIGGKLLAVQHRWATGLNKRTAHWSRQQQILFVVLACGALSALNLVALVDKSPTTTTLHQKANVVPIPKHWVLPNTGPQFNRQDTLTFQALRQRLDSLMATDTGRQQLQAFNQRRPGFLDSLLHIERQIFPTLPPINIFSPDKTQTP